MPPDRSLGGPGRHARPFFAGPQDGIRASRDDPRSLGLAPEDSIYSYESEFAQALLGQRPGDRVVFSGEELEVAAIEPWKK